MVTQLVPFHQLRDSHVRDKSVEKGKKTWKRVSTRSVTSDEGLQFFLSVTKAWLLKQQSLYNNFKQLFFVD